MKIFVVNKGSSSIKCTLFDLNKTLWTGHIQWKNDFKEPKLTIENYRGVRTSVTLKEKNSAAAFERLMQFLVAGEASVLKSFDEIDAVGHRIVHGGNFFTKSTRITPSVKKKIRTLQELAPLHNQSELEGIEILEKLLPKKTPQIAVFDTAFHHTMPIQASIYPGPYKWYEEGIKRYGFHGISFQYCSKRSASLLKRPLQSLKMVICHLGSGASLCAVEGGKSIDTTMGFTPLEGLMMDTRSGSIDPGLLLYFMEKKRSVQELTEELYKKSGLLGISGISSDMRDIIEMSEKGDLRAKLALDTYIHRLNTNIGSMIASLKGLDVLVFTAGIGENAAIVRERVSENFAFLGLKLDKTKNKRSSLKDRIISTPDSKVKVLLIYTQEAFEIANECELIL